MGRFNSGQHGSKKTTRNFNTIDVRKYQREGLLIPGKVLTTSWTYQGQPNGAIRVIVSTDSVRLVYRLGGDAGQERDYPVTIERTPCHYGGSRVWWQCPKCERRVALLYSGKTFVCRHCLNLAYESDRVAPGNKPYRRANRVRVKLGWGGGVASPQGSKPKGMHWATYGRLLQELNRHSIAALGTSERMVTSIQKRLDGTITR